MAKRVRLEEPKGKGLQLQSNRVDFGNLKERATRVGVVRGRAIEGAIVAVDRVTLKNLVEDFETLVKALKKSGVRPEYVVHYSEEPGWKKFITTPPTENEIPAFLRKEAAKPTPVKVEGKKKRVRAK